MERKHYNQITPLTVLVRVLLCIAVFCVWGASNTFGDTGDVIDDFLESWLREGWICYNPDPQLDHKMDVFADVDEDGTYDTHVVFIIEKGRARVFNSELGGFSRGNWIEFEAGNNCGGNPDRARVVIRFVDLLAPDYNYNDSSTWVYKKISSLRLEIAHGPTPCSNASWEDAMQSVKAYRNHHQQNPIEGIYTPPLCSGCFAQYEFSDIMGIEELYIYTDFCENVLDNLILRTTAETLDTDGDGIEDAHDNCPNTPNGPDGGTCIYGKIGDPCMSMGACSDGPPFIIDSCSLNQEDDDGDGIGDACDNCPETPNGPEGGTCIYGKIGEPCMSMGTCSDGPPFIIDSCSMHQEDDDGDGIGDLCDNCPNTLNPLQEDTYPPGGNGIGDTCDCEGNFDCDDDVDADDVEKFLADFGRFQFDNPCANDNQCHGDCECDGDVDADDIEKFMEDFGRFQFNNPCPACVAGDWCSY